MGWEVFEPRGRELDGTRNDGRNDEFEDGADQLRLGQDVRFVLVVVGGGAVRVGREIARRHLRYLETVAVNCDARVQELEEFDRRVYLGPQTAPEDGTGGSPAVGGRLARAAEPALDRLLEGATFVTVVASLGGGSGTGALPFVLEAASRAAEFVSVFAIKPFECEGDRRAVADRALARLHFLEGFVEKQESRHGALQVLDNEALLKHDRRLPLNRLAHHWAELITGHIEHSFVRPIEAAIEARRLERVVEAEPVRLAPPTLPGPTPLSPAEPPGVPMPLAPHMELGGTDAELTFETFLPPGGTGGL